MLLKSVPRIAVKLPRLNQIADVEPEACRMQIVVVIGCEHGDCEHLQRRALACINRRLHRLRIGMYGEEVDADASDALDAARDSVAADLSVP